MVSIKGSSILKYILMPQILPRIKDLGRDGFGFIAWSMACVFEAARLLPANHAYTSPVNIGKFGLRHVLGQAALNLKFNMRHADQILIYGLMLVGVVLLMSQLGIMIFTLFVQAAAAGALPPGANPLPGGFAGFFVTAQPQQDVAFMLMDRVFGVPGMFNSCVAMNTGCFPTAANPNPISDGVFPFPYHIALQQLLAFYSYGVLAVGALILCYYVVTLVVDTATTGTPFGKRFDRVWAPLRLIVAIGLLIPTSNGLNAAQYITLTVAKFGSSFATNGWNYYISNLGNNTTLMGEPATLIGRPNYPASNDILQFMALASTCEVAYERMYGFRAETNGVPDAQPDVDKKMNIRAWLVRSNMNATTRMRLVDTDTVPFTDILSWFDYGDIVIVFGDYNPAVPDKYKEYLGGVKPYCGEVTLPITRGRTPGAANATLDNIAMYYFQYFIYAPWIDTAGALNFDTVGENIANRELPIGRNMASPLPTDAEKRAFLTTYDNIARALVDNSFMAMQGETALWTNNTQPYGWAGAGIWYNKVAEVNGDYTEAVFNFPRPSRYPLVMEQILSEKGKKDATISGVDRYSPLLSTGEKIDLEHPNEYHIINALNTTVKMWENFYEIVGQAQTGNAFVDALNNLFQKSGLWSFRQNEAQHPMAALVVLGKSLIIKSIGSFALGAASSAGSGLNIFAKKDTPKHVAKALSSFFMTVSFMALTAGILLNYVVPFLPFMYFLFAVMGWVKTVFEAMVGVPLWALAHLRYDKGGFPTAQSMTGYFLLIDIFLRPILIIFGLLASSVLFYALARTMNNIFTIVISNLAGFDTLAAPTIPGGMTGSFTQMRGVIDQIFYTIMYAVIIYMMGTACFKLIDLLPNNILRWMGTSVRTFSAMAREDAGGNMKGMMQQGTLNIQGEASRLTGGVAEG